jgi:hypothetical protein
MDVPLTWTWEASDLRGVCVVSARCLRGVFELSVAW